MRAALIGVALLTAACSGNPTGPSPTPNPAPTPQAIVSSLPCPAQILGFTLDLGFYQQLACNTFDGPQQPARRWMQAPRLYIRTVDEAGTAIDAVTLDTVQQAMVSIAPTLTAGRFGVSVERGTASREGQSGYITVKWLATTAGNVCGRSQVAVDGGWMEFSPRVPTCGCQGSAIRPGTAQHELGHALGYWHTDGPDDLMTNLGDTKPCERPASARELQAFAYHYR